MRLILLLLCMAALGGCDRQSSGEQQGEAELVAPVKGVDRSHAGKPFPATPFSDPDGEPASFAEFKGKPTLVNLWATWCAPCVKELPTLNALAAAKGEELQVVPISQDMGPHASVVAFLDELKVDRLDAWQDSKMALSGALGTQILPTTILYDADGREVWRYVGELDWNGEEAAKLLAEAR